MSDRKRVVLCGSAKGNTERFKEFTRNLDIDEYSVSMPPLFNYDSLKNEEQILVCKSDLMLCDQKTCEDDDRVCYKCRHWRKRVIEDCDFLFKGNYSKVKEFLNEQYIKKIEKADIVIILNHDKVVSALGRIKKNYIGGNTFVEICNAIFMGKLVYLTNPIPEDLIYTDVLYTWWETGKIQFWECYGCDGKEPQFEDCGTYCKKV